MESSIDTTLEQVHGIISALQSKNSDISDEYAIQQILHMPLDKLKGIRITGFFGYNRMCKIKHQGKIWRIYPYLNSNTFQLITQTSNHSNRLVNLHTEELTQQFIVEEMIKLIRLTHQQPQIMWRVTKQNVINNIHAIMRNPNDVEKFIEDLIALPKQPSLGQLSKVVGFFVFDFGGNNKAIKMKYLSNYILQCKFRENGFFGPFQHISYDLKNEMQRQLFINEISSRFGEGHRCPTGYMFCKE
jgi:hypothetical protein